MPKKDPDLQSLRKRFQVGKLYKLIGMDKPCYFWSEQGDKKLGPAIKSNDLIFFLKLERGLTIRGTFRIYAIFGENVGYFLLKRYEVFSALLLVDFNNEQ